MPSKNKEVIYDYSVQGLTITGFRNLVLPKIGTYLLFDNDLCVVGKVNKSRKTFNAISFSGDEFNEIGLDDFGDFIFIDNSTIKLKYNKSGKSFNKYFIEELNLGDIFLYHHYPCIVTSISVHIIEAVHIRPDLSNEKVTFNLDKMRDKKEIMQVMVPKKFNIEFSNQFSYLGRTSRHG